MSNVESFRCDACGLNRGEDGRASSMWAEIYPPCESTFGIRMKQKLHYCLNCWSEIEKTIPKLPMRPCAPKGK